MATPSIAEPCVPASTARQTKRLSSSTGAAGTNGGGALAIAAASFASRCKAPLIPDMVLGRRRRPSGAPGERTRRIGVGKAHKHRRLGPGTRSRSTILEY